MCSGPDPVTAAHRLEESLAHYSNWYTSNLLAINSEKTNIMTISNKKVKLSSLPVIKFNSINLKQCEKIKYLGIFLDRYLTLKQNLAKTKQKIYPVIQNFHRNRKFITPYVASIWYTGLIRPMLEYGAPALYTARKYITSELARIENRCLKIISLESKSITRYKFNITEINIRLKYLYLLAFYKLSHSLVPPIDNLLLPKPSVGVTRLGASGGFLLGGGLDGIGVKCFNDLPSDIRAMPTIKKFKTSLKKYLFNTEIDIDVLNYLMKQN